MESGNSGQIGRTVVSHVVAEISHVLGYVLDHSLAGQTVLDHGTKQKTATRLNVQVGSLFFYS